MPHLSTTMKFLQSSPSLDNSQFQGPAAAGPGGYDNIQFWSWDAFRNTPSMVDSYTDWRPKVLNANTSASVDSLKSVLPKK